MCFRVRGDIVELFGAAFFGCEVLTPLEAKETCGLRLNSAYLCKDLIKYEEAINTQQVS